jgi:hypothetical protein
VADRALTHSLDFEGRRVTAVMFRGRWLWRFLVDHNLLLLGATNLGRPHKRSPRGGKESN